MNIDPSQMTYLALVAQRPDPSNAHIQMALQKLTDDALAVAHHILGVEVSEDPQVRQFAERLREWVDRMRLQRRNRRGKGVERC